MKTLLVFPPASDPAHPPLGITSLAGFLQEQNETVDLLDLNILSYHYLLSPASIGRCAATMRQRLDALEEQVELSPDQAQEYRLLAENHLSADFLQGEISRALADIRDPTTYLDRQRYAATSSLIRRAMELVSAAHYPVRWYPRGFSMSWLPTRSSDVLAATTDRSQNLFIPFFESHLEEIAGRRPGVVGISLNYYCQMIPCMTLAAMLRRRLPDVFIVVGGGLLCFFDGKWEALGAFRELVDAWIPFEGEVPLHDLVAALGHDDGLSKVPGVLRFEGAVAHFSPPRLPPEPSALPPPSFDGLPLSEYLTPEPVLPMLGSRGCYWTRCAFCSHYQLFRRRFRMKSVERILAEMNVLARRYACQTFYLTDESIPPGLARRLAATVRDQALPFNWFGESRFERALDDATLLTMKEGGCRMLMFGLESGVPRLLDLMEKGTNPELASVILAECAHVGIRSFVMFFIGFPTETLQEAEATIRFVEERYGEITHIAFSNFILEQQSPVFRQPARYGVTEILPFAGEDLKIYAEYRVSEGLSAEQAIAFLERARERPKVRALIDLYLISRTHLAFLPAEKDLPLAMAKAPQSARGPASHLYPVRPGDLVPSTLAFNLDEIRERLAGGSERRSPQGVRRCPTSYVFSPLQEKLFEVGEDGLSLLAPCDGRFSLAEILAAVAAPSREAALTFFTELEGRGALRWETRA